MFRCLPLSPSGSRASTSTHHTLIPMNAATAASTSAGGPKAPRCSVSQRQPGARARRGRRFGFAVESTTFMPIRRTPARAGDPAVGNGSERTPRVRWRPLTPFARMHVCLVYDCLFPWTVGGAERWMRNVAEALAEDGPQVPYLTGTQWPQGEEPELPGVHGVAGSPAAELYGPDGKRR